MAGGRHYGQELVPKPLKTGEKYLVLTSQKSEKSIGS